MNNARMHTHTHTQTQTHEQRTHTHTHALPQFSLVWYLHLPKPKPAPQVPGVAEANHHEPLLPWGRYNQGRLVLGASVEAACAAPADLLTAAAAFREGPYLVTYRWGGAVGGLREGASLVWVGGARLGVGRLG